MKINQTDIDFLRYELIKTLPTKGSAHFILGYKENVESFLDELEIYLQILIDFDTNEAEIDISDIICCASSLGRVILNLDERNDFLKGAEQAEKICFECLLSYLDKRPTRPAA